MEEESVKHGTLSRSPGPSTDSAGHTHSVRCHRAWTIAPFPCLSPLTSSACFLNVPLITGFSSLAGVYKEINPLGFPVL
jgi:hypothetical protein